MKQQFVMLPITIYTFDFLTSNSKKFKLLLSRTFLVKREKRALSRTIATFLIDFFDLAIIAYVLQKYDEFSIFTINNFVSELMRIMTND